VDDGAWLGNIFEAALLLVLGAALVVPGVLPNEVVVGVGFAPLNMFDPELPAPTPTLPKRFPPPPPPPTPVPPNKPPVEALDVSVGGGPAGVVELPMPKVVFVGAGVVEPPEVAPNILEVGALFPNRPPCVVAGVDPAAGVPGVEGAADPKLKVLPPPAPPLPPLPPPNMLLVWPAAVAGFDPPPNSPPPDVFGVDVPKDNGF